MASTPDIDPYAALGVSKDATVSDIRAAHRKRVLKCHPDKIQDESQRNIAQDEFQRVQQAYELLSDETRRARYDQKAKLAELKREILERRRSDSSSYFSPRGGSSAREMRDGRIVEERVPVEVFLDEELRFTDEPRPMARKYEEYGKRPKAKTTDEKKKTRPMSSYSAAKDLRDSAKATLADRAKQRDRDRKRQASAKYEEVYEPFSPRVHSDDGSSDSSDSDIYVHLKKPSPRPSREPRSRPNESSRRRERIYDDDEYLDRYGSKHDGWHKQAEKHIERTKYDGPRSSRSPQRHRGYDSAEPESSASRRSGRSSRSIRNPSTSRNNSYEHLDASRSHDFKPPKMPTSSTSPGHKASIRPSLFSARTATATASAFTRKREGSGREEPTLEKMVRDQVRDPLQPRSSRRYDSGYSSPSTPEMPQRGSSPKVTTTRYKIDDPVVIEPSSKSKYRSSSPERDRAPRGTPKRASTYAYVSESSPRIEVRTVRPSRAYGDVEFSPRIRGEDVKYTQEIRPSDAAMSPGRSNYYSHHHQRHPPPGRRQSAYA